jgi:transcriptional regulator with XRE-family HTH domain
MAKKPAVQSKYKEDYARMAQIACEEGGFTDQKLAKLFDVSKSTINNWKKDFPEFKEALKAGKDIFDITVVEASFLKRCSGFFFNEVTREPVTLNEVDPKTDELVEFTKMVVTKRVRKYVVPDAKGCMDWLTNRAPNRWKKSKHVEITGKDGGPVKTDSIVAVPSGPMSIEQWEHEVREARKHDKELDPGQIPGNA